MTTNQQWYNMNYDGTKKYTFDLPAIVPPKLNFTNSAETHFEEGNVLHEQGKLGRAIKSYIQALKINPDFDVVYYNMGRLLMNIKFKKPIPNLTEIICKILEKEKFIRPSSLVQA